MTSSPWPEGKEIRVRGSVPVEERDLGIPNMVYRSLRKWTFTYPMAIVFPTQFAIGMVDRSKVDVRAQATDEGIVLDVVDNREFLRGSLIFLAGGDEEPVVIRPGSSILIRKGTLVCNTAEDESKGESVALDLDLVNAVEDPSSKEYSANDLSNPKTLSKALVIPNMARSLAEREDLSSKTYAELVACPDPIARYKLLLNPALPFDLFPWACCYPEIYKKNPACQVTLADRLAMQMLSTFPEERRNAILSILNS